MVTSSHAHNVVGRRKRVMHIITRLIKGGAQKMCLDIMEGLPKNRYETYLVSGSDTGLEGSLWPRVMGMRDIRIKTIPGLGREVSLLKDIVSLFQVYAYLVKIKPDVVHCHTSKAGFIGCAAAWLAGVPAIAYSPHGHLFAEAAHIPSVSGNSLRMKIFYLLRRAASFMADKTIALNEADKKEQVLLKLAPAHKYEIIPNGIEIRDDIMPGRSPTDKYPVLTTIGRLSPEKGHAYLLDAVKLVKNVYPDIVALIIGDGPLRPALESQAEKLGIKDNIRFLGVQDNLHELLQGSDIFVLPSLYESFGIVLLEAMAAQKPVVASRVNGVPEVVEDGKTGILAPPADSKALSETIIKLSRDKELARKMGQAGYRRVNKLFRKDRMIAQFDALYNSILNGRRR